MASKRHGAFDRAAAKWVARLAVRAMHDAGTHTIDELAGAYYVSRPTVYRSLQRTRTSQNEL